MIINLSYLFNYGNPPSEGFDGYIVPNQIICLTFTS